MLNKTISILLSILLLIKSSLLPASGIDLPDIGTSAISTLSIGKEIEMGDYYIRMLRANAPIIHDPLLNEYINSLGQRLVDAADDVKTPFHFYILQSDMLNAFAFFGGHVVIHSRLILDTESESQLASVLSHEIGHITQRHLARAMELKNKSSPYFWGAALGSILLAMANPEAGIAALFGTVAGSSQSQISFTQSNEKEADRIGLITLNKAGFDPFASMEFLQKVADESRYTSKMPEMLFTHPLPESRLTDIRNRLQRYQPKSLPPSLYYYLAKARLAILLGKNKNTARALVEFYKKQKDAESKIAVRYSQALMDYKNQHYQSAKEIAESLLQKDPNNIWYIDLITDIDFELQNNVEAIQRLETALQKNKENRVLQINLANGYVKNARYQQAINLLHRYTYANNDDINGWELLVSAYNGLNSNVRAMSAQAEIVALRGQFPQAIQLLQNAQKQSTQDNTFTARLSARIQQLEKLQNQFASYR